MRSWTRVFGLAAGLLALVPAAAIAAAPAAAAPFKGLPATGAEMSSSQQAVMQAQVAVDAAADRIEATAGPASGFAGISVDVPGHSLNLYWQGDLPTPALRAVAAERAGGVGVAVVPAVYSRWQLEQETRRLAATLMRTPGAAGVLVQSITARYDGAGLDVGVSAPAAMSRAAVTAALESPVHVNLVAAAPIVPLLRENDFAPYWGGAEIISDTTLGMCSSGFAVALAGMQFLLSAAHCSPSGISDSWSTGAFNEIAGVWLWAPGHDDLLIGPTSAQGRIYDGAAIGMCCQFSKPVIGLSSTRVGDFLCTSGAFSGAVCNIKATATGVTGTVDGNTVFDLVEMDQQNHTGAAGNGDSGGPVFSLGSNVNTVIARGTITGGVPGTSAPCHGVPAGNGRSCSWRVVFPDITRELGDSGATIMTN